MSKNPTVPNLGVLDPSGPIFPHENPLKKREFVLGIIPRSSANYSYILLSVDAENTVIPKFRIKFRKIPKNSEKFKKNEFPVFALYYHQDTMKY